MVASLQKCGTSCRTLGNDIIRTKTVTAAFFETSLRRCLTTFDITFIGVGHMIGAGAYVLTGAEARKNAGPGILIAYFLAGVASLLSALCYAEFGARVPKAGSAYTYTYVSMGEVYAFIIGWDMVLEYCVGAASVASSMSGYIWALTKTTLGEACSASNMTNRTSFNYSAEHATATHPQVINEHLDWVGLLLVVAVCIILALGVRSSTNINTAFVFVNLTVICFIVIYGFMLHDIHNWSDNFLPFGFSGVLKAGASCFFAYAGFDGIAISGEEAKNPSKSIPYSTFFAMLIVTICYCLMSASLTIMIPYYLIDAKAAFAEAFATRCIIWAKYLVSVGAIAGMLTTMLGQIFSLPRTAYAMACDGLIFRCLGYVNPKTQVPLISIIVFGIITAAIALLINLEVLVDLLAIGTLNAYSFVSASVLLLRYSSAEDSAAKMVPEKPAADDSSKTPSRYQENLNRASASKQNQLPLSSLSQSKRENTTKANKEAESECASKKCSQCSSSTCSCSSKSSTSGCASSCSSASGSIKDCSVRVNADSNEAVDVDPGDIDAVVETLQEESEKADYTLDNGGQLRVKFQKIPCLQRTLGRFRPGVVVRFAILAIVACIVCIGVVIKYGNLLHAEWWMFLILGIAIFGFLFFFGVICLFDQNKVPLKFKVQWVPFIPVFSVAVNTILVVNLDASTWLRFMIWLIIGMVIYLTYGVNHSGESKVYQEKLRRQREREERGEFTDSFWNRGLCRKIGAFFGAPYSVADQQSRTY